MDYLLPLPWTETRVAFPDFPSLPRVPELVNPDAWLSQVKGKHLVRRVNRQDFVKVDLYPCIMGESSCDRSFHSTYIAGLNEAKRERGFVHSFSLAIVTKFINQALAELSERFGMNTA